VTGPRRRLIHERPRFRVFFLLTHKVRSRAEIPLMFWKRVKSIALFFFFFFSNRVPALKRKISGRQGVRVLSRNNYVRRIPTSPLPFTPPIGLPRDIP